MKTRYFKILKGQYTGFVGRVTGHIGICLTVLVQTRDQWVLAYVKPKDLKRVKRWEIIFVNGTNYIKERL